MDAELENLSTQNYLRNHAVNSWNEDGSLIMLVLVGLIASAIQSTFAQALEDHIPQFRRCNQDELGDRRTVEFVARQNLSAGFSVCIDRTNVDEQQRSHWINIAKEYPSTKIWCLIFETPLNICRDRLQNRIDHPTIRSPEQGYSILHQFRSGYSPPTANEGLERIFRLRPSDHPSSSYTKDDLDAILTRIATSEPPKPERPQPGIRDYFMSKPPRGRDNRSGWRGTRRAYSGHSYGQNFDRLGPARGAYTQPNWRTRPPTSASTPVSGSEWSNGFSHVASPDRGRNVGQGLHDGYNVPQGNRLAEHGERESQAPSRDSGRPTATAHSGSERGTADLPINID